MSDLVSGLLTDLNIEAPLLELDITLDVGNPAEVTILQNELATDEQGISLATTIEQLNAQITALGNTNVAETMSLQLDANNDQSQLLALDLTLCFAHGTHILTERGEVPVEHLAVGDRVITPHGSEISMPIRWIGRQHYEGDAARFAQPVLVRAGALGDGFPHRDLHLSRDHCLYLAGRLVPAKLLINGTTIIAERGYDVVDYANIELDRHAVVLAEGVATETYLDCGNRSHFENAGAEDEWLSTRPVRTDAAWSDGTAFAPPLWEGPELTALVERYNVSSGEKLAA